jgi:hypothetical protein
MQFEFLHLSKPSPSISAQNSDCYQGVEKLQIAIFQKNEILTKLKRFFFHRVIDFFFSIPKSEFFKKLKILYTSAANSKS